MARSQRLVFERTQTPRRAAAGMLAPPTGRSTFSWCLSQLSYRVLDNLVHELSIGNGVAHEGIPMQSHIGRSVSVLEHQSLHAPLLAESVIRGVIEKVVHSFLPYASLHGVDNDGHASVKFARHINRMRIFIQHSRNRGMTAHNMLPSKSAKAADSPVKVVRPRGAGCRATPRRLS